MKPKIYLTIVLILIFTGVSVHPALAQNNLQAELAQLRAATAKYHQIPAAQAAGYNLVPGLDFCFNNPGVGSMGFHLINVSMLDTVIDPLKPEAFVYAPARNGKLKLVAVEYIVPAAAWDAVNSQRPTLFGQTFGLDQSLGVYELHAWIWKHNPSGMFFDWNPDVSCN